MQAPFGAGITVALSALTFQTFADFLALDIARLLQSDQRGLTDVRASSADSLSDAYSPLRSSPYGHTPPRARSGTWVGCGGGPGSGGYWFCVPGWGTCLAVSPLDQPGPPAVRPVSSFCEFMHDRCKFLRPTGRECVQLRNLTDDEWVVGAYSAMATATG
jgi:hypothetical protein